MKQLGKAIKFELFKLIKNKSLVIGFCVFFVLLISILGVYVHLYSPKDSTVISEEVKAFQLEYYQNEKEKLEDIIEMMDNGIPPPFPLYEGYYESTVLQIAEYSYFLETGTIKEEFVSPLTIKKEHTGSNNMIVLVDCLGWLLPIFAIVAAHLVINSDYKNNTVKNILASPITKKTIYSAKATTVNIVLLAVFVLSMIYPMIEGLRDLSAKVLLCDGKVYYSQSLFTTYFIPKAISILLSMVLWASLTQLAIFVKNKRLANILPLSVYALIQICIAPFCFIGSSNVIFSYLPLLALRYNLRESFVHIFDKFTHGWLSLMFTAVVVIGICVTSACCCAKKIEKEDLRS